MRLRFIWVGKTRNPSYRALQEDYLARLSHFANCIVVEVKDSTAANNVEIEGKRIIEKLNPNTVVCLLDCLGKNLTSPGLAKQIMKWQEAGAKEISFIIGGSHGVSDEVATRADFRLSLSFLTFTHEMARVVLLEQIYRAYTIIRSYPYQK